SFWMVIYFDYSYRLQLSQLRQHVDHYAFTLSLEFQVARFQSLKRQTGGYIGGVTDQDFALPRAGGKARRSISRVAKHGDIRGALFRAHRTYKCIAGVHADP